LADTVDCKEANAGSCFNASVLLGSGFDLRSRRDAGTAASFRAFVDALAETATESSLSILFSDFLALLEEATCLVGCRTGFLAGDTDFWVSDALLSGALLSDALLSAVDAFVVLLASGVLATISGDGGVADLLPAVSNAGGVAGFTPLGGVSNAGGAADFILLGCASNAGAGADLPPVEGASSAGGGADFIPAAGVSNAGGAEAVICGALASGVGGTADGGTAASNGGGTEGCGLASGPFASNGGGVAGVGPGVATANCGALASSGGGAAGTGAKEGASLRFGGGVLLCWERPSKTQVPTLKATSTTTPKTTFFFWREAGFTSSSTWSESV